MKELGIGVIGCGAIFPVHLESIYNIEGANLKIICDIEKNLVKSIAKKHHCKWTTDFEDVLKDKSIDVVHILTPHYLHTPMAIKAIESGKHVVLEKPVGINFEELRNLKRIVDKNNFIVGVILQNRFNPSTIKMKEIINSGILGKFIASKGILTWCRKGDYYEKSTWRGKLATEGGGLLINQAIHTLDLLEYIGGPIKEIKAYVVNNTHPEIEVEDTAMIVMYYESGAVGNFFGTNSYGDNSDVELGFIFEKGKLLFRDQQLYLIKDGKKELIVSDVVKKGDKSYWGMSHKLIIEDIYKSIMFNSKPKVSLEDAIRTTELVLHAYNENLVKL